ncbi:uncharacterized protein LOC123320695 isoform X2 [Coccinella septempunctata]|uniref:uncharacterized protein LOC123320695 isoform X2 n=1 Tax=Coccinella septempunctata TaxID=41139 RepID=UPI001D08BDE2|nr:uncharacterized protein LOC123320695 isoform X2 [Coccinella septempunctata]
MILPKFPDQFCRFRSLLMNFAKYSKVNMSVLNQSGEEQVECPLCMEALEVDDLNFFPCTCGYQICRFCWHRIRTDENGLCPACRKAYSEDPADFIPLSKEQVAKLKADKRHRDQQRKAKLSENRKHLASVRVVQRNLVFVVGLPVRLADPELLKKHEYFGKFGKIHKVVINQSTSYAGSQGPSASAYVTYMKSDDALRAIQSVNNIMIDGRMLKSSLGTTKYCSHFMKNQPCPKADCMYLHDFDPEASFTKEQMHAGKHQEYEKKLHDAFTSRQSTTSPPSNIGQCDKLSSCSSSPPSSQQHEGFPKSEPISTIGSKGKDGLAHSSGSSSKDSWPQLSLEKGEKTTEAKKTDQSKDKSKSNKAKSKNCPGSPSSAQASATENATSSCSGLFSDNITVKLENKGHDRENFDMEDHNKNEINGKLDLEQISNIGEIHNKQIQRDNLEKFKNGVEGQSIFGLGDSKLGLTSDNSSFFSQGFQTVNHTLNGLTSSTEEDPHQDHSARENDLNTPTGGLSDTFPSLNTSEDWVFGFENDHLEELATQATRTRQAAVPPKDSLDTLVNGISTSGNILGNIHQNVPSQNGPGGALLTGYGASKFFDDFESSRRYLDGSKLHENTIMDSLIINNSSKTNGFVNTQHFGGLTNKEVLQKGTNGLNGLDHNMSKFFMDFHKNQTQLNMLNGINSLITPPTQQQNGYYQQQQTAVQEHLLLLQQKQLEEQLRTLNIKQQQNYQYQNGFYGGREMNSSSPLPFGGRHVYNNMPVQGQTQGLGQVQPQPISIAVGQGQNKIRNPEDELDFDPFQETQKGLAELIATEKSQTQGRPHMTTQGVHMNGLIHSQSNPGLGHMPPPPPGFVQPQNSTHMNSFGSKILPFLNMSNNPQSLNSPTHNWPNGYVNPQKNISTNVNDWKNLDPAILSSSRHFPLANITAPPIREHSTYQNLTQQSLNGLANLNPQTSPTTQTQNVRPHSYMNGSTDFSTANIFSNFTQQLQQPNLNGFTTTHTNQLNNWFTNEAFSNTNITSPPGFRNSQSKQQEC